MVTKFIPICVIIKRLNKDIFEKGLIVKTANLVVVPCTLHVVELCYYLEIAKIYLEIKNIIPALLRLSQLLRVEKKYIAIISLLFNIN